MMNAAIQIVQCTQAEAQTSASGILYKKTRMKGHVVRIVFALNRIERDILIGMDRKREREWEREKEENENGVNYNPEQMI